MRAEVGKWQSRAAAGKARTKLWRSRRRDRRAAGRGRSRRGCVARGRATLPLCHEPASPLDSGPGASDLSLESLHSSPPVALPTGHRAAALGPPRTPPGSDLPEARFLGWPPGSRPFLPPRFLLRALLLQLRDMAIPRPLVLCVAVVLCILVLGGGHHHKDKIKDAVSKRRGVITTARRSRFKRVVSFGDSLSDAGCASLAHFLSRRSSR